MLLRFYYSAKPLLPWRLRIAARRIVARRQRRQAAAVWPIDPAAGVRPPDWPGWPEGKQFAVVLTHDVERPEGLQRCRRLAALEASLRFRSSFNFVPGGAAYSVSPEVRRRLTDDGFEIGVHDFKHDGRLFQSRDHFAAAAPFVNRYLEEWEAVGFRAGFMFHQPEWIGALNIDYDSSTFDTDPFEPQPDAAGTIFPFLVSSAPRSGRPPYVELPYTLPQDSTLFLLLQERTPDIWMRKLDWIAARGGMALLNVHPDYLRFDGERPSARTYPVQFYRDFLTYLSTRYGGAFWQPLPRELAQWYRAAQGATEAAVLRP